jgi:hypothetical protein
MSVKTFVGAAKKQDAKKALQARPVLVLFYMIGCPHCEANKPAWDEAKKRVPNEVEVLEVEASATPDDEGVDGFPTMKYKDASGKETVTSGEKKSGAEIESELKLPKAGGLRRRRSLRRTHRRRDRKLRHRTLRNYVPLR